MSSSDGTGAPPLPSVGGGGRQLGFAGSMSSETKVTAKDKGNMCHENFAEPLRREVIARRSDAEPPADEGLEGVIEVLAKAPVLLRADARAEERN